MFLQKRVILSELLVVIDDIKYTTIESVPRTARVGNDTAINGNADSTSRTKDVIIESRIVINFVVYTVTEIGQHSFRNCQNIKNVFIPDTVTTIHDYAFYMCYKLETIFVPGSITSIGTSSFNAWNQGNFENFIFCGATDTGITLSTNSLSGGIKEVIVTSHYIGDTWKGKPLSNQNADDLCLFYPITNDISIIYIHSSCHNSCFILHHFLLLFLSLLIS